MNEKADNRTSQTFRSGPCLVFRPPRRKRKTKRRRDGNRRTIEPPPKVEDQRTGL